MKHGTSTDSSGRSTAHGEQSWLDDLEAVFRLPERPARAWDRPGMSPRTERMLDIAGMALLGLFVVGWVWSFATAKTASAATVGGSGSSPGTAAVTAALTNRNAVSTAYLTDAALSAFTDRILAKQRGASGKLQATFQTGTHGIVADTLPPGAEVRYTPAGDSTSGVVQPTRPGIWRVALAVGNALRPVGDFNVITMLPFSAKERGKIGTYFIGSWPAERGAGGPKKAPADRYANPSGFIEVTLENRDTKVSEHFRLRDFLTKDQPNVWPKYLVLQPRLLDKLELVLADLRGRGIETRGVRVLSGFRTPQYNEGGGNTSGRADLSRHMFGDASDIYIDNDGNGVMDDLNRDGRVDINDARVILAAEDRVETEHPELIGGGGLYRSAAGHGPFIHIDTRGYRARW
jgi:hypothetical protein